MIALTYPQVHRSPEFNIVNDLPQILRYFRHCLAVVATSSPTSSPHNIRRAATQGVQSEEEKRAEENDDGIDDDEEYDIIGFQKRVFHFKTADYDEEDILHWL